MHTNTRWWCAQPNLMYGFTKKPLFKRQGSLTYKFLSQVLIEAVKPKGCGLPKNALTAKYFERKRTKKWGNRDAESEKMLSVKLRGLKQTERNQRHFWERLQTSPTCFLTSRRWWLDSFNFNFLFLIFHCSIRTAHHKRFGLPQHVLWRLGGNTGAEFLQNDRNIYATEIRNCTLRLTLLVEFSSKLSFSKISFWRSISLPEDTGDPLAARCSKFNLFDFNLWQRKKYLYLFWRVLIDAEGICLIGQNSWLKSCFVTLTRNTENWEQTLENKTNRFTMLLKN